MTTEVDFETPLEIFLGSFKRVVRGITRKETLIAEFQKLEGGAYNNIEAFDESRRRTLLDLPTEADEAESRSMLTTLSRDLLLEQAATDVRSITDAELTLLATRLWGDPTPEDTAARNAASAAIDSPERLGPDDPSLCQKIEERVSAAQRPLYKNNEQKALANALKERWDRLHRRLQASQRNREEKALARALPWVRERFEYHKFNPGHVWGYICVKDAWVQLLTDEEFEKFDMRIDAVLSKMSGSTGAEGCLGHLWYLSYVDSPPQATPVSLSDSLDRRETTGVERNIESMRHTARDLKARAENSPQESAQHLDGFVPGMLENTFPVFDQACYRSIVAPDPNIRMVDDMYVLAVDADYTTSTRRSNPAEDARTQHSEYRGYTRVRLQQIVNRFFDLRWLYANEVNMSATWRVAQMSHNKAFASLDASDAAELSSSVRYGSLRDAEPETAIRSAFSE